MYIEAVLGGALIGLASALPLWWEGRIAGASGILEGLVDFKKKVNTSLYFTLGLISGPMIFFLFREKPQEILSLNIDWKLFASAFLVGLGARMGGGCTSGHGVCGISRLSKRSLAATAVFLGIAILVATFLGGI
jgi:uncharacterized membrane protein YedE/YeeE